jgi:Family of unknown function (DUF5681)
VGKEKDSEFRVGYQKPPRHSRFKPGQSGNPTGRPKKKATTFAELFARELNRPVTLTIGGKRRRIPILQAIAKQYMNMAVKGDHKATALVMKAVEPRQSDSKDDLSPVLHAMLALHARHEVTDRNGTRVTDAPELSGNAANDHDQADKDEN